MRGLQLSSSFAFILAALAVVGCEATSSGSTPDGSQSASDVSTDTVSGDTGADLLDIEAPVNDSKMPDAASPGDAPLAPDLPSPPDVPNPNDTAVADLDAGPTPDPDVGYTDVGYTDVGYTDVGYTDVGYTDVGYPDDTAVADADAGPAPDVVTPEGPTTLVAAGWSFGECMGACIGVLDFKGAAVTLTVKSYDETIDHLASGILTTGGAAQLETVLSALDGVPLNAVYGCPDCADGGAKTITLSRGDVMSTHSYEYGAPPSVFTDLDGIIFGAAQGLRDCVTSEAVVVLGECPAPLP